MFTGWRREMLLQDEMRLKKVLTITTGACPDLYAKQPHDSSVVPFVPNPSLLLLWLRCHGKLWVYSQEFACIMCGCGQHLWGQRLKKSAEQVLRLASILYDGNTPPSRPVALRASNPFR